MTQAQKWIKYGAITLAVLLAVGIISGLLTAAGTLLGWLTGDGVLDEMKTYSIDSEITSLELEIGGAEVRIETGKAFSVESNLKHLTVEEKNGCLCIEQTRQTGFGFDDALLILYVPQDFTFREVDLETGAGMVTIEALSAETISLNLGAGEVNIDNLCATKSCEIDGGAGSHGLDMEEDLNIVHLYKAYPAK